MSILWFYTYLFVVRTVLVLGSELWIIYWLWIRYEVNEQEECIPVGCIPTLHQTPPSDQTSTPLWPDTHASSNQTPSDQWGKPLHDHVTTDEFWEEA